MNYDDDENVVKSRRDLEIPLGIEDGSDIESGGIEEEDLGDESQYDESEEEKEYEVACGKDDHQSHDSSDPLSPEPSDSSDEDFVPESSTDDEAEITRRGGRAGLRREKADVFGANTPRKRGRASPRK
jgi:hypothetical protein